MNSFWGSCGYRGSGPPGAAFERGNVTPIPLRSIAEWQTAVEPQSTDAWPSTGEEQAVYAGEAMNDGQGLDDATLIRVKAGRWVADAVSASEAVVCGLL